MDGSTVVVGWAVVGDGFKVTNRYETACWFEDVLVAPGRYPIRGAIRYGVVDHVYARFPGTVTANNRQALYGGSPISRRGVNDLVGQATEARWSMHGFLFAEQVAAGAASRLAFRVEMEPGFSLSRDPYVNSVGEDRVLHQIRPMAEAVRS